MADVSASSTSCCQWLNARKNKVTFGCNIPGKPLFTYAEGKAERKTRAPLKSEPCVRSLTCQAAPSSRPDTATRSKRSRGPGTARTRHSSGSWNSWPPEPPPVQSWKTRRADPAGVGVGEEEGAQSFRFWVQVSNFTGTHQAKTITHDKEHQSTHQWDVKQHHRVPEGLYLTFSGSLYRRDAHPVSFISLFGSMHTLTQTSADSELHNVR